MTDFEYTYPPPPYHFGPDRVAMVTYQSDGDAIRRIVPRPLLANQDDLVSVYVGRFDIVKPVSSQYAEMGVMIPASFSDGRRGFYFSHLCLNRTLPIVIGREIWGYPKEFAETVAVEKNDRIVTANVVQNGTTLVEFELELTEAADPKTAREMTAFLLKSVPSAACPSRPALLRLIGLAHQYRGRRARWHAQPRHVHLAASSSMSPHAIPPIRQAVSAMWVDGDGLVLDRGELLYDYLQTNSITPYPRRPDM